MSRHTLRYRTWKEGIRKGLGFIGFGDKMKENQLR